MMIEKVLQALEQDCRVQPAELAARFGTTEEAVRKIIAEAERDGSILGYGAIVHWAKAKPERVYALIDIAAQPERDIGFDQVAQRIARFPAHSFSIITSVVIPATEQTSTEEVIEQHQQRTHYRCDIGQHGSV